MKSDASKKEPEFIRRGISEKDVAKFSHWISSITQDVTCLELYRYPRLMNKSQLDERIAEVKESEFNLLPVSCLTLVKYSLTSRGILHDLKQLANADELPSSVKAILGVPPAIQQPLSPAEPENVPGILSENQQQVIRNASQFTLSQVIGPPGTGKSYTIASLALERYLQGESVLIAGQNNESVNVVGDKLEQFLGENDFVVRVGDARYHKKLKRYLDDLLDGYFSQSRFDATLTNSLQTSKLNLTEAQDRFVRQCEKALKYGARSARAEYSTNMLDKFLAWLAKKGTLRQDSLHKMFEEVCQQQRIREKLLASYISQTRRTRLSKLLNSHRHELNSFRQALYSVNSSTQQERFENTDWPALLKAMPVWLGTMGDLHRSLPMQPELFDLVIIDEATQCDIASILPAIYRAKHVVIVGDPKQLKFISFLSRDKQKSLQQNLTELPPHEWLNYRSQSAVDFASLAINNQQAITLLDEHFRSKPDLIEFSNRKFYRKKLKLMRQKPVASEEPPLRLHYVEGNCKEGKNREEALQLLNQLNVILTEAHREGRQPSIGILSPFREQVILLQRLLPRFISEEQIRLHKIKVETPWGFQGEERDVMLLSFCIDSQSSGHQYRYMNKPEVFNVAITRARDAQHLFLSVSAHRIRSDSLLFEYIHSCERQSGYELSDYSDFDSFQAEVSRLLTINGINTWKNYPIAGTELDLVCHYGEHTLALDLIGYPGASRDYYHLHRYQLFQRANLALYPLSYTRWLHQKQEVILEITALLNVPSDEHIVSQANE